MGLFKLLALLRALRLKDLLDYPDDLRDSESVRTWVSAVVDALSAFADLTDTEVDDTIVNALLQIVNNDAAWNSLHSLLVALLFEGMKFDYADGDDIDAITNVTGFNPMLIFAIVQVIRAILEIGKNG